MRSGRLALLRRALVTHLAVVGGRWWSNLGARGPPRCAMMGREFASVRGRCCMDSVQSETPHEGPTLKYQTTYFCFFIVILTAFTFTTATTAAAEEGAQTSPLAEIESVKAFDRLMATVGQLRATILQDAKTEREVAEGMRFILRTIAMSQDVTGDGDSKAPHFARMDTQRRKIGGDNPNAEYDNVVWDGATDYKITGQRGSVDHLSFTVLALQPSGRSKSIGYLNERDLELDAKGNFTIWLTAEKPKARGNWIQTGSAAGRGSILVRQYMGDRDAERLATYRIDVMGRDRYDPLPPSTDAEIAEDIDDAALAIRGIGFLHRYVSPALGEDPNTFKLRNSDDFGADISSTDNLYVIGTYDFGPEEALIIEVEALDVRYWNLAIENPWHESVDYLQRKTSRTHDDVRVDGDGKIRFVLAHGRTDHANYLETAGHQRGFMTFRWVGERDMQPPLPTITRVPLAEAVEKAHALAKR